MDLQALVNKNDPDDHAQGYCSESWFEARYSGHRPPGEHLTMTKAGWNEKGGPMDRLPQSNQSPGPYFKSKRSSSMTLFQAFTKSLTNLPLASFCAYTSLMARSCELLPKIRSTRVPVHFTWPLLSQPS